MCGIVGVIARPGRFEARNIERAVRVLRHRGPDDEGVERICAGPPWELWLGHTRLSILDLSPAGHQPMIRAGEGAICFNGELYNHRELRRDLEAEWEFRSRTDTEVLLAGVLRVGPAFVRRANAMMATAIWNARDQTLLLVRDRMGKKPLFVYRGDEVIAFASELKAFEALGLPRTLDREALAYYRWLGYVPGERSIWKECRKLPAASMALIDLRARELPEIVPELFWDPFGGAHRRFSGSFDDAVDATLALLDDATRLRLDADVPVGVFLSSGIDSGLVASSIARQHSRTVTAFIVRTARREHDESSAAREVARRLGLEVQILEPRPEAYARQFEQVAFFYDEPHAAASALAVMGNAEQARRSVTVVLTGDGGDEIFLGYPWAAYPRRIAMATRLARWMGLAGPLVHALKTRRGRAAFGRVVAALGLRTATLDKKIDLLEAALAGRSAAALYEFFSAATPRSFLSPEDLRILGSDDLLARARRWYPRYSWGALEARSTEELLGGLDLVTYLRDDVLQKVDRGTMAYAVEARSPFLDYRLVELGLSLPLQYKIRLGVHKRVLRAGYARRIGPDLARAPKRGFFADDPPGMPDAPTREMRWVRAVETAWRARWLTEGPTVATHAPQD